MVFLEKHERICFFFKINLKNGVVIIIVFFFLTHMTYGPILPSLNAQCYNFSGFEIFQNIKIRTFQNLLRNFL